KPLAEEALAVFERAYGAEHYYSMTLNCSLGRIHLKLGDTEASQNFFEGVIPLVRSKYDLLFATRQDCEEFYTELLVEMGDFEGAEAILLDIHKNISADPEAGGLRNLPRVALSLAAMYEAWGKPEEAAAYKALADSLQ